MSDIVKEIREGVEGVLSVELPNWSILDHKFDLTKNHFNNSTQRFGVKALEGPSGISILKNYTVARTFEITFVQGYDQIQSDDMNQQDAVDIIEDAIDRSLIKIINTKAGVPANVLNVDFVSIDEPDFSIEHVTFVNLLITISYKRLLG